MKESTGKPLRVLIADDHLIVRMGLVTLLENSPGIVVVGDAEDGNEAVRKTLKLKPDVVIMDLMMPEKDGTLATAEIKAAAPEVKILILTTFAASDTIAKALAAGASGAILKSAPKARLLEAIRAVASGRQSIADDVKDILAEDPPAPELTARQAEILKSVTLGLTNRDIASQLGISPTVVKEHLNATFGKLGAANRAEAIAIALRKHLLKI